MSLIASSFVFSFSYKLFWSCSANKQESGGVGNGRYLGNNYLFKGTHGHNLFLTFDVMPN